MCAQCHFPRSGLDFIFLLQLISRVQNHEGFCQEEVLGQVKTEHKVAGGCGPAPCPGPSQARPHHLQPLSPGRNREASGRENRIKVNVSPGSARGSQRSYFWSVCFQEQIREMSLAASACRQDRRPGWGRQWPGQEGGVTHPGRGAYPGAGWVGCPALPRVPQRLPWEKANLAASS